jgi:hypothetical protein
MQQFIVFAIVLAAGAYLARMIWMQIKGKKDCACGTGGCAKPSTQPAELDLIQIAPRKPDADAVSFDRQLEHARFTSRVFVVFAAKLR